MRFPQKMEFVYMIITMVSVIWIEVALLYQGIEMCRTTAFKNELPRQHVRKETFQDHRGRWWSTTIIALKKHQGVTALTIMNCFIKWGSYNVMPWSYSYLQVYFKKQFDGAVSITVELKDFKNKVGGVSPRLRVRAPVKPFFLLSQRSRIFSRFTCLQKKTCFDVLCTCKMARLVWRYGDDAGAIIENV